MEQDYLRYINQNVKTCCNNIFLITKYISEGGNGFVFECKNERGRIFVLKLLNNSKQVKIENFKKEIELQKEVNSEYTVKCVDSGEQCFGRQKKPRPFYIMEKYDASLEDLINGNKITPIKAYKFSIQLCQAIKALHKRDVPIIHRDLKPENILYDAKKDKVLLCDFGLAHIETNHKTINEGFVGNIDYHAPEQKIRGKAKIGTYTDIYSLGLIINVLFTGEIAQGNNYKRVWQVSPYFSFIDVIVDRMIMHSIETRESDINSILVDLEKYDMEYEVEESFFRTIHKDKKLTKENIRKLIDLFSLYIYSLENKMNWSEINLNYYCDFHFSCENRLRNTLLIKCFYERIKDKFEYEGDGYRKNSIPYNAIDLSIEQNKNLFDLFVSKIDSLDILDEMKCVRNIIKKYFVSLCDYHAKEIFEDFKSIEEKVDYYCLDAPILSISYFLSKNLPEFVKWSYEATKFIVFDKYDVSNVIDKYEFTKEINKVLKELGEIIKTKFITATCSIKNDKLEVFFDDLYSSEKFEKMIIEIASLSTSDILKADLLDIIEISESVGLNKLYLIDKSDAATLIDGIKKTHHSK